MGKNIVNSLKEAVKTAKKSFTLMAIAKGSISKEGADIKRYIGIGACKVVGFNPTKAQMKELMGYEPKEEQVYFGVQEEEGKKIPFARLSFVIKTIPEKCGGIELTQMLTYFIRNQYYKGSQSGKYQVIDEFGRTAWGTKETIEAKGIIEYSNGPANVTTNYRPAFIGEEEVTEFIKTLINIPNPANYVNGSWIMKTGAELQDSICRLDEISKYFTGNFSEMKEILTLQPDNFVKVLFGIREVEDENGKVRTYQDVYTKVLRSNTSNYDKLQEEIETRQQNGGLKNRTYEFCELKEYKVEATNYTEGASNSGASDPFANAGSSTPWGN